MSFRMHFHDLPHSNFLEETCQRMSQELQDEFPEMVKVEVTHTQSGLQRETIVHVTGKDIDLASTAQSKDSRESVSEAFERLRRQLRKHHDKQIFTRRRHARAR